MPYGAMTEEQKLKERERHSEVVVKMVETLRPFCPMTRKALIAAAMAMLEID